jgi:hypothetical protein
MIAGTDFTSHESESQGPVSLKGPPGRPGPDARVQVLSGLRVMPNNLKAPFAVLVGLIFKLLGILRV